MVNQGVASCLLALLAGGCVSDKDSGYEYESSYGEVSFWADFAQCGSIPFDFCVNMEGDQSCSSPQYAEPACGDLGPTASIVVSEGTHDFYAYVAAGQLSGSWEGTVGVGSGTCTLVQLEC